MTLDRILNHIDSTVHIDKRVIRPRSSKQSTAIHITKNHAPDMFSTSLRTRPDVSSLVPTLSSPSSGLRETPLQTHDLSLPIPSPHPSPNSHPQTTQPPPTTTTRPPSLHTTLLTPLSLTPDHRPSSLSRIERLSTLTPSRAHTAIIFILSPPAIKPKNGGDESGDSMQGLSAYMDLQVVIQEMPTPPILLPVLRAEELVGCLRGYVAGLGAAIAERGREGGDGELDVDVRRDLLKHVTSTAPRRPLTEHTTFLLGDVVSSLRDLAVMATTEGGKRQLGAWIEEREVRDISDFWEEEWVAE